MTKVLITGARGHLGAALVDHIQETTEWNVASLSRRFGGRMKLAKKPVFGLLHDLRAPLPDFAMCGLQGTDYIIHLAGEVHGIRSLTDPASFVESNVLGTFHMLELARRIKPRAFLYVSTAEVYGPSEVAFMPELYLIPHKENAALHPQTPYAASKAAAEALVHSYYRSFGVPTIVVRPSNFFGERQATDKFIPKILRAIQSAETVDIHTSETGADKRQWIHTYQLSAAILHLLERGLFGSTFNIAGEQLTNLEVAKMIAAAVKKPLIYRTKDTSTSPGHNVAYAIDDSKIQDLGGKPTLHTGADIFNTVKWTLDNPDWL